MPMRDGKIDRELYRRLYSSILDNFSELLDKYLKQNLRQLKPGDVLFENDLVRGVLKEILLPWEMIVDVWISPIEKITFKGNLLNMTAIEKEALEG
jgi:hypothetical protein